MSELRVDSGASECRSDNGSNESNKKIEQTWFHECCGQIEVGVNGRMNEKGDGLDKNDTITDTMIPGNLGNLNNSTEILQDIDLHR